VWNPLVASNFPVVTTFVASKVLPFEPFLERG
jgi:hypothetical protein